MSKLHRLGTQGSIPAAHIILETGGTILQLGDKDIEWLMVSSLVTLQVNLIHTGFDFKLWLSLNVVPPVHHDPEYQSVIVQAPLTSL